jgi:hypothetical protein
MATKYTAMGDSSDSAGAYSPAAYAPRFRGGENGGMISEGVFDLAHGRAAAWVCPKKNTTHQNFDAGGERNGEEKAGEPALNLSRNA